LPHGTDNSDIGIDSGHDSIRHWKIRKCSNLKVHPLASW
jgi:hypothetical protein